VCVKNLLNAATPILPAKGEFLMKHTSLSPSMKNPAHLHMQVEAELVVSVSLSLRDLDKLGKQMLETLGHVVLPIKDIEHSPVDEG